MDWWHYLFVESGDPRVYSWPLMQSPLGIFAIISVYLCVVLKWGPDFMRNRRPFDLKIVIAAYNFSMIVMCSWVIYAYQQEGIHFGTFMSCVEMDFSDSPTLMRVLSITWWVMMAKVIELVDTVFFVLRKKQKQVSVLHVYHHASTLFLCWLGAKYVGVGVAIFSILVNSFVHVLMYSYYFLSIFRSLQHRLRPIKPYITVIQMVQFTMILVHIGVTAYFHCTLPTAILAMYFPNVVVIFYMFYNFYQHSYVRNSNKGKK
ncbi:elongation of very long chain fatty acids protein 4-like [Phlebotomus argentipes]|uniref:elongation of very long chain fatty acids protein 4-like n=1 Tax=Phlebotomus argentipes TaxID=94469 RepID=UPI002892C036|nr:elongation of very long chain fatty acids protein 4-like [Phlebotomus argentipes]